MRKKKMNQEQYEKDLAERQRNHLERVKELAEQRQGSQTINNFFKQEFQPCAHDQCPECHGTGIKIDGTACVHMISCPCAKCNPFTW